MIAFYASLWPDCSSQGPVVIRLTQPAEHGTVSFEADDSWVYFSPGTPNATCNAKKAPGTKVFYDASEQGYEGSDSFQVFIIFPSGTASDVRFNISVR
jgi:hypothetical protein